MDFNDTPEEATFRAEARAWLDANAELRRPDDRPADVLSERTSPEIIAASQAWQKKKADGGWACLTWPTEYGGRAATSIQNVIWGQEEARYRTPPNIFGIGTGMCGPTILTHGNDDQKAKWIPKLLSGEEIWCQLFSEPSAGSDLAGLRSTAVRDGDDWVVNGQKIWTTGAQFCDWGILVVRSDANVAKHSGLTYFVVDMHSPGVEIRPITQINRGQGFNEVFFTDVRIPDAHRISEVGNGWAVAITTLMNERASIGGGGGGSVNDLIRLAKSVEIDGRPAIEDSAVRQQIARFYTRIKGVKMTGNRTLSALSQGKTPGPEASLGKLVGAKVAQEMASFAIELQGAAGALDRDAAAQGGDWQGRYLAIPGLRIAGGTDEILRNIISERVLGLPPESRADKGIAFKDIPTGPPS
ncbi:MAG: acyl-CoA dehydrogenase family protein [Deltaproteobacteria bacterium]|nr:acyl-CoA dehydrogenase family protein [Deltaproteobacteria bacterium]